MTSILAGSLTSGSWYSSSLSSLNILTFSYFFGFSSVCFAMPLTPPKNSARSSASGYTFFFFFTSVVFLTSGAYFTSILISS
jgi:hypothetical protein